MAHCELSIKNEGTKTAVLTRAECEVVKDWDLVRQFPVAQAMPPSAKYEFVLDRRTSSPSLPRHSTTRGTLTCGRPSLMKVSRPPRREGVVSGRRNAAVERRLWRSLTAMVFQWQCTWRTPRRMKSRWSRPPSRRRWCLRDRSTSLGTPLGVRPTRCRTCRPWRRADRSSPQRPQRKTQDGRPLRRYRRRWKVERLFAWLQNYRRIVVRYERHSENFLGMLHFACCLILLRCL